MRLSEHPEKFHCCRVEWERHALILRHEKQFDSKYRMSYGAFKKLVSILEPDLEQNNAKIIINSCGDLAISPSHILGLMICWCSGSSFHDIHDAGNFSHPTFDQLQKTSYYYATTSGQSPFADEAYSVQRRHTKGFRKLEPRDFWVKL